MVYKLWESARARRFLSLLITYFSFVLTNFFHLRHNWPLFLQASKYSRRMNCASDPEFRQIRDRTPHPERIIIWINQIIICSSGAKQHIILEYFKQISIHPFMDGNGRVTRLLMERLLVAAGYPFLCLDSELRNMYGYFLDRCQFYGSERGFICFVVAQMYRELQVRFDLLLWTKMR